MCEAEAERIVEALRENPMSCAIVDGDSRYRMLLSQVIEDLGFDVSAFDSSRKFEKKNIDSRFDVVILSWNVRPFSGAEIVESIRGNGEPYPSLIIGCDGGESASFQLALSPVGFLFKPFDARHLMELLAKAVEIKKWTL